MIYSLLLILALPLAATAGGLDPSAPRGLAIHHFVVPGSGNNNTEMCVIPRHLPFGKYKASDSEDEITLCTLDFYKKDGTTEQSSTVAICPKTNSTSAGILLYSIPQGKTKASLETASACAMESGNHRPSGVKNLGKYKQTDDDATCTSTQSILGYYHVARALGDIGHVNSSVIRTMDFQQHERVTTLALGQIGRKPASAIYRSWENFRKYKSGSQANPSWLFTNDDTQIYGAIIGHGVKSDSFTDWVTNKSNGGTDLTQVSAFKNLKNPADTNTILGDHAFSPSTVQGLVSMRDMSEMLLIDYLMSQADRFSGSNIDQTTLYVFQQSGEVKSESDVKKVPSGIQPVPVKSLVLNDNDCGIIDGPGDAEKKGYFDQIQHFHPETYARLMELAERWNSGPETKAFFRTELLFSDKMISDFGKRLMHARDSLKEKCKSSEHFLDLDLDDFIAGREADQSYCDVSTFVAMTKKLESGRSPASK